MSLVFFESFNHFTIIKHSDTIRKAFSFFLFIFFAVPYQKFSSQKDSSFTYHQIESYNGSLGSLLLYGMAVNSLTGSFVVGVEDEI